MVNLGIQSRMTIDGKRQMLDSSAPLDPDSYLPTYLFMRATTGDFGRWFSVYLQTDFTLGCVRDVQKIFRGQDFGFSERPNGRWTRHSPMACFHSLKSPRELIMLMPTIYQSQYEILNGALIFLKNLITF